jgi:uncharacterized protein YecE (DUF72 family)
MLGRVIHIGTAGFSYKDWRGVVYPPGLPEREWLGFYAGEFDAVELNVTFYRVPAARTVAAWVERTPAGFCFAVKAHRGLTHERDAPDFAGFATAVQPLRAAGKLACVLAQFPQSFHPTPANHDYLARLRAGLAEWPVVVEFRNAKWVSDETFARLRALALGYAAVDEPRLPGLMPPTAAVTGPVGYVRFHGRNARQWHAHTAPWQRYDYDYSEAELREWAPRIRAMAAEAEDTLVIFNNTPRARGVEDARALRALLNRD